MNRRGIDECYRRGVLEAGSPVPDVAVWAAIREEARPLSELLGEGRTLLCFYVHDWSPT
jgi:hypothetical protein